MLHSAWRIPAISAASCTERLDTGYQGVTNCNKQQYKIPHEWLFTVKKKNTWMKLMPSSNWVSWNQPENKNISNTSAWKQCTQGEKMKLQTLESSDHFREPIDTVDVHILQVTNTTQIKKKKKQGKSLHLPLRQTWGAGRWGMSGGEVRGQAPGFPPLSSLPVSGYSFKSAMITLHLHSTGLI